MSPLKLIVSRRFLPFFLTQASGAFNDNVFKNALMLILAFTAANALPWDTDLTMNLAAGLFILPFLLFSATAGTLADAVCKTRLIRALKLLEIGLMLLAGLAFYFQQYLMLLGLLFLMGSQSAFFGPVKYAILPQLLTDKELLAGNAWVEMGTFVAILLGTITGGLLVGLADAPLWIAGVVVLFSVLGYLVSRHIPAVGQVGNADRFRFAPWQQTKATISISYANRTLYLSIMAISWFWFLGASYLTQFPNFTKTVLGGDNTVVTALLVAFSVGVGIGSMLCERLSGDRVELGIVPIGSVGLTLFGVSLYFSSPAQLPVQLLNLPQFLASPFGWWVLTDLTLIGVFGGLFIVPLYALLQQRAEPQQRARVIAANNIFNALFMVVSAIAGIVFLTVLDLAIPEYFLILAIMNAVVALYVYSQLPEFALRFAIYLLSHTMYRVNSRGLEHIPPQGAAVLVANHVSYVDALLIAGAVRRPVRFVMEKAIYDLPVANWLFKAARTIPICSKQKNEQVYEAAFAAIKRELEQGNLVCIFPEGRLTKTGDIDSFRPGIERILAETPVPVVPMALQGLWGSFFSHHGNGAFKFKGRLWSKINLHASEALPATATAAELERQVRLLRGDLA
ncbi:MAG: MFS transporter [Gammaproteobacteria bacterium]|nr:MFS transporter [Gammaproteobacteria bacterium]MBU1556164.1 MFS transporter [Gammaproteobacteria bacterium]MBU2070425.1 MFS transporter [Gammaproteobacteria bacterium]MBU2184713.1 MFS transporter [Gammaproteobacteria bacterium]MBU2203646.1 MFS transporter [Gammaproteobacteria bacterium]